MSFDTAPFLGVFLPLMVLGHWLIPARKGRNFLLLAAGLVFYAFGSLQGLMLLIASALGNYLLGLILMRFPGKKWLCALAVGLNLAFLIAYQYLDFLLGDVLRLPQLKLGLAAPVGISFFTFKAISYVVDTYRDTSRGSRSFFHVLLYLSFFPQVMAGPITRFGEMNAQFADRGRGELAPGLRRFIVGLGKKLIFAGLLAQTVDAVFGLGAGQLDFRLAWIGAVGYMLQIYFDFSGYSDMAIGLAQMFGFTTPENFRYPYVAASITDFWRRWHISLSSWFRDYLYIPLGGNRKGVNRTALNKFIVFTLCGIWHGAAWSFVVWGLWHGLFTALESRGILKPQKWHAFLGRAYTLLVVCLGFVVFRAATLAQGFQVIAAMFSGFSLTAASTVALHALMTPAAICVMVLGILLCVPWMEKLERRPGLWRVVEPASYLACLMLLLACLLRVAAGGFAPFIYFQF